MLGGGCGCVGPAGEGAVSCGRGRCEGVDCCQELGRAGKLIMRAWAPLPNPCLAKGRHTAFRASSPDPVAQGRSA